MIFPTFLFLLSSILVCIIDVKLLILLIPLWCVVFFLPPIFSSKGSGGSVKVLSIVFGLGLVYITLCQIYMMAYNYDYLLAHDTFDVFLPRLKDFMMGSQSYGETLSRIWKDYVFWDRFQVGYYSFLAFWGTIANGIGANFYACLQIGNLFICSFGAVLLNSILQYHNINARDSQRYAIIISLITPLFIYSTMILRDGLIALIYVYMIYVCHKQFNWLNVLKLFIAAYVCTTLRIETGLFSVLFIPFYFLINWKSISHNIFTILILVIFAVYSSLLLTTILSNVQEVSQNNYNNYSDAVDQGDGVIGFFQRIPIVGPFASIIYTALMPMPCWARLTLEYWPGGWPEVYNAMQFPTMISAFFQLYVIMYLVCFLFSKQSIKTKTRNAIWWLMLFATIFLYVQSAVVEQRRILGAYCVFYIIWAIAHHSSSSNYNRNVFVGSVVCFGVLQLALYLL